MTKKRKTFVVLDGNALIHRSFHALPPLTTKDGRMVNAVYGFTAVLLKVFKELKPDYWAVAFDVAGPTFRHKEYKEYKATRVKAPQELYDQIPIVKKVAESFNIPVFEKPGFEADDLIGTIVDKKTDAEKIIITGDGDALQLISDDIRVYKIQRGITDTLLYDKALVKQKYGLTVNQLIDYKALRGDPSDNIPGVKGIGEKTAVALLQIFGSLDNIYQALEKNDPRLKDVKERIQDLLTEYKKDAYLSQKLGRIVTDVPIKFDLEKCAIVNYDRAQVTRLFQDLEFGSLLNRLPDIKRSEDVEEKKTKNQSVFELTRAEPRPKRKTSAEYRLIDNDQDLLDMVKKMSGIGELAIDTETTDLDPFRAKLVGISLCWKAGEAYYLPLLAKPELKKSPAFEKLTMILADTGVKKIGHNIKFDLSMLEREGIELRPLYFDTMMAAYLLNPGVRQYSLNAQAFTELGYEMQPIDELIGPKGKKQKTMAEVPIEEVSWYAAEDADYTFRLKAKLEPKLAKQGVEGLFHEIEMPLIRVLTDMEKQGVKIDSEFLKRMGKEVGEDISQLEKEIHKLAGEEFNVQSPKQLKEILFDKLRINIQGVGKTKTGLSTAAAELDKLKDRHPIIPLIIQHRELAKLKNTYLDALPELVNPETGRVHTSFNQTIAATGRLSSTNPNLQNIPIRTKIGNEIRKAFIAERGCRLVSVDYSQIELRVIASMADDPKMIATFKRGEDIHATTASAIHDVPLDKVDKNLRRLAKEVNFGVIYGLGSVGLAQRQGISRAEAKDFIDKYFKTYVKVKEWIERTKKYAKETGYVETLYGRRRYLPEINSPNHMLQAQAERFAVNMPIQGTAADLMKVAMLEVAKELPAKFPKARMLLQVHDELVIEAPTEQAEEVGQLVQELMVKVSKLRVPVEAAVEIGLNWGSLKEIE
ncbi:MAG: DNA polymerase I [bacterium]